MASSNVEKTVDAIIEAAEQSQKNQLQSLWFQPPSWEPDGAPYPWQAKFVNASKDHREKGLICPNQVGKSRTGAAEAAMHSTGLYPDWYEGRRFEAPTDGLVAGITDKDVRNTQQKQLLGPIEERKATGIGWIPAHLILGCSFRQAGVNDVVDVVRVKHITGGTSTIQLQAYQQGVSKFQGVQYDWAWLDEEPDREGDQVILHEVQTRLWKRSGLLTFTRTPLEGYTKFVSYFWQRTAGSFCINIGIDQAPHFTKEQVDEEWERTPVYLRDAKFKGIPTLGSGAIFQIQDDQITWKDPGPIPDHWARIIGIDFGIDHPAAVACLAYDRDTDTIYVYDVWKQSGCDTATHAAAIRGKAIGWVPVAWPHDGDTREKGSGMQLIKRYQDIVPTLLSVHAQWESTPEGHKAPNAVEPGIQDMLIRMQEGRLKVHPSLSDWFSEKNMYHRDEGQIVKEHDDLMDATRYGVMMLRFSATKREVRSNPTEAIDDYDPLSNWIGGR